jgi:hypothetical protein
MVRRSSQDGRDPRVSTETERQLAWCYFRNLVHTVYREARHVGPSGDRAAKLCLDNDHPLAVAASRCSKKRSLLKGVSLFKQTAAAKSVDGVLGPYRDTTALELADLVSLFAEPRWASGYGGSKWAAIGRATAELAEALDLGKLDAALRVCALVQRIEHNTRRLVPSLEEWRSTPYLREKWPELCR